MSPFQICVFLALFAMTYQQPHTTSSRNEFAPLRAWRQDRLMRCIFCMNYDDYNNLSTYGCDLRRVATCVGNICYMRQHKKPEYFLYTSGCLNLTRSELATVWDQILSQNNGTTKNGGIGFGNETQLCEVGSSVNTCICTDRPSCNNVTSAEPFLEYTKAIFSDIDFDELAHFKHLLPNDHMLSESGYILIANSMTGAFPSHQIPIISLILLIIINCIIKNAF